MALITTFSKILCAVLLLSVTMAMGQSKTVVVELKYNCSPDKLAGLLESKKKLKSIKDELVKEGKLIQCSDWYEQDNTNVNYEVYCVAESKAKYDAALVEFTKRATEKFPEAVKIISEACQKKKDTVKNEGMLFPVVKGDFGAGVMVVENIDEKPDPSLNYNIVFDFISFPELSKKKGRIDSLQMNWGLSDLGRIYNLHVAGGIPKKKVNIVVAVHGYSLLSFLTNEAYQKKYKTDNPNLEMIQELSNAGVKFLMCGQAMHWGHIKKEQLIPLAKVALSAKTTISSYQAKGYMLMKMEN